MRALAFALVLAFAPPLLAQAGGGGGPMRTGGGGGLKRAQADALYCALVGGAGTPGCAMEDAGASYAGVGAAPATIGVADLDYLGAVAPALTIDGGTGLALVVRDELVIPADASVGYTRLLDDDTPFQLVFGAQAATGGADFSIATNVDATPDTDDGTFIWGNRRDADPAVVAFVLGSDLATQTVHFGADGNRAGASTVPLACASTAIDGLGAPVPTLCMMADGTLDVGLATAGTDATYAQDGIDRSSASTETFTLSNSGAGSVNLILGGDALPDASGTRDLGADGLTWDELYIAAGTAALPAVQFPDASGLFSFFAGGLGLSSQGVEVVDLQPGSMQVTGAVVPEATDTRQLGSLSRQWSRAFVDDGSLAAPALSVGDDGAGLWLDTGRALVLSHDAGGVDMQAVGATSDVTIDAEDEVRIASGGRTLIDAEALDIDDSAAPPSVSAVNAARLYYDGTDDALMLSVNGGAFAPISTGGWTMVTKAADQSLSNDDVVGADSDLQFAMAANTTYRVRGSIVATSTSSIPDIQLSIDGPAAPTQVVVMFNGTGVLASTQTSYASVVTVPITGGSSNVVQIDALIQNGANAGTFSIEWAQANADATATTLRGGSFLEFMAP